jgi:hypothetical protein
MDYCWRNQKYRSNDSLCLSLCLSVSVSFDLPLGLTASSGIGEYVTELYCQLLDSSVKNRSFENDLTRDDLAKDGLLGVSICAASPLALDDVNFNYQIRSPSAAPSSPPSNLPRVIPCPPVPPLAQLAKEFQENLRNSKKNPAEGTVTLFGRQCRVTHPITSFGLESYPTTDMSPRVSEQPKKSS